MMIMSISPPVPEGTDGLIAFSLIRRSGFGIKTAMKTLQFLLIGVMCMVQTLWAAWKSPHPLSAETEAPIALIPFPRQVHWDKGCAKIPHAKAWKLNVNAPAAWMKSVKVAWKGLLHDCSGLGKETLHVTLEQTEDILPPDARAEGYDMQINEKGVQIRACSSAGFFYGLQTLRQLAANRKTLPYCHITDWPAFRYRGYLQDCGRNFRKLERLKKELDLAARLKVNLFHWHLTDNPAWHVQCKAYPQLNAAQYRSRDVNETYSYAEIRELIEYARQRHITVLPELDMPGHSAYFNKAFGFSMHSEKGMKVVGELLDEFCREISKEMCPMVHFGADEVKIPNTEQFVNFVVDKLKSHGRVPVQWASRRDLGKHPDSIGQRWLDGADVASVSLTNLNGRTFDSIIGYTNVYEPALMVRRYFFMRPCAAGKGDELRLGTIMGIWPDGRVEDKTLIPEMCNMWPAMCAMVERAWQGGDSDGDAFPIELPAPGTEAHAAYHSFVDRALTLRRTVFANEPFPLWRDADMNWTLVKPVDKEQVESTRKAVLAGELAALQTRPAHGASLYFRTREGSGCIGLFPSEKPGKTVWAVTTIKSAKAGKKWFMIGFDAPERSNRRYSGLPAKPGDWDVAGSRIWVNGKEIKNPHRYKYAGERASGNAWQFDHPPLAPEEMWWMLPPVEIPLVKGKNTIVIEHPFVSYNQAWQLSFIPMKQERGASEPKKRYR